MRFRLTSLLLLALTVWCIGSAIGSVMSKGHTFSWGNTYTFTNLHQLVDNATVGNITHLDFATANKDGATNTPSLRTLGTNVTQALGGLDNRISYIGVGGTNSFGYHTLTANAKTNLATYTTVLSTNINNALTSATVVRSQILSNLQGERYWLTSYTPRYTNSVISIKSQIWNMVNSSTMGCVTFLFVGSGTNAVSVAEQRDQPATGDINRPLTMNHVVTNAAADAISLELRMAKITGYATTGNIGTMSTDSGTFNAAYLEAGQAQIRIIETPK